MASAPTTLPISNQPSESESQPPSLSNPALRSFLNRLSSSTRRFLSRSRPWIELVDRSSFARPESLSDAASRIRKNLSYFKVNYISLLAVALALSLITHPFSLFLLLSLLGSWSFLYAFRLPDQPVVFFNRTFSDKETLAFLVVLTVLVLFLTSVGSLLISTVMVGVAFISLHGAFRVPEDLFLDDQEASGSAGLLSFLGGVAPAVASRV
ncbi:hypothetical protein MLD38_003635 [Melastoma candidum]|uniref:Uncharacterized protein n=1 Tax=Melastoma candidum TaxID=119954 RepID=A0ACB9S2F7_9MYRT|nr:hypothetical protein MLD38_003635 [Melastoma candidum]